MKFIKTLYSIYIFYTYLLNFLLQACSSASTCILYFIISFLTTRKDWYSIPSLEDCVLIKLKRRPDLSFELQLRDSVRFTLTSLFNFFVKESVANYSFSSSSSIVVYAWARDWLRPPAELAAGGEVNSASALTPARSNAITLNPFIINKM